MSPFEPQGPRARWRVVYDVLVERDVNDTVTYRELADALDMDPDRNRHAIQMATQRAARTYLQVDKRAIAAVPNVGYRVVRPEEHMALAQNQQRRSTVALQRGHDNVTHVDVTGMELEVRKSFEAVARAFSMQIEFNRRMDIRQSELEETINNVSTRTEDELRKLQERLARLEQADDEPQT